MGGSLGLAVMATIAAARTNGVDTPEALTEGYALVFTTGAVVLAAGALLMWAWLPRTRAGRGRRGEPAVRDGGGARPPTRRSRAQPSGVAPLVTTPAFPRHRAVRAALGRRRPRGRRAEAGRGVTPGRWAGRPAPCRHRRPARAAPHRFGGLCPAARTGCRRRGDGGSEGGCLGRTAGPTGGAAPPPSPRGRRAADRAVRRVGARPAPPPRHSHPRCRASCSASVRLRVDVLPIADDR